MDIIRSLLHQLSDPDAELRLHAAAALPDACRDDPNADLNAVFCAMERRASPPGQESDIRVRDALWSGQSRIAKLRTQRLGFMIEAQRDADLEKLDLIRWIWSAANIYGSEVEYERSLRGAPKPLVSLWALTWADAEICNGGFHQFLTNSTGIVFHEAIDGLELFQANAAHALFVELGSLFPNGLPARDRRQREAQVASIADAQLDALSSRYYDLAGDEAWQTAAWKFIHEHPGEFVRVTP